MDSKYENFNESLVVFNEIVKRVLMSVSERSASHNEIGDESYWSEDEVKGRILSTGLYIKFLEALTKDCENYQCDGIVKL